MGSVVALDAFRESARKRGKRTHRPPRPEVVGAEIWGRDYRDVEAVVFGLLKVRAIVAHHAGDFDPLFDFHCLNGLEAAYRFESTDPERLTNAIASMKEWILDFITDQNKRDLSWALVILDLIEKSPAR